MDDRLTRYLERIARLETECAATTMKELPNLGVNAQRCYEAVSVALEYMACAACCGWGCAGGDHRLEHLIGGATNSAYAALCLAKNGYYDQALSSARSVGETANLLALFDVDRTRVDEWKNADERTRKNTFSAVRVRLAIETLNAPLPIKEERYSKLSTFSIHVTPQSKSQAHHNPLDQAIVGPMFQPAGFLLALNEIAISVAFIVLYAGKLLEMKYETREVYRTVALALGECFGGIMATEQGRPWFKPEATGNGERADEH